MLSLDVSYYNFDHYIAAREGLKLDVRLVSLCQACFATSLQEGLRFDVRLV